MVDIKIGSGPGVLFIVFLILKLTAIINWSWWWVTAPLWIPAIIVLIGIGILGIYYYKNKAEIKKFWENQTKSGKKRKKDEESISSLYKKMRKA